jgi:hypothetical protein
MQSRCKPLNPKIKNFLEGFLTKISYIALSYTPFNKYKIHLVFVKMIVV